VCPRRRRHPLGARETETIEKNGWTMWADLPDLAHGLMLARIVTAGYPSSRSIR
jgi:hypothetical protein